MSDFVQIASYSSEIEAELSQATLAAGGIDSFLRLDDTGGMFPVLQQNRGVKLLVGAQDEGEARTLLSTEPTAPAGPAHST